MSLLTTSTSAQEAADLLGVTPNPKYQPNPAKGNAPPSASTIRLNAIDPADPKGSWLRAFVAKSAVGPVPAVTGDAAGLSAEPLYPETIPTVMPPQAICIAILDRVITRGAQNDTGEDLANAIWRKGEEHGVGKKQLNKHCKDEPLSPEQIRPIKWEIVERLHIPIIGYRLAKDRAEVSDALQRRGRYCVKMANAYEGLKSSTYFTDGPTSVIVPNRGQADIEQLCDLLRDEALNSETIAEKMGRKTDFWVRDLAHDARLAGLPIISQGSNGYKLAANKQELDEFLGRFLERIKRHAQNTRFLKTAGQLWYPQTETEHAAQKGWCSTLHNPGVSDETRKRARASAAATARALSPAGHKAADEKAKIEMAVAARIKRFRDEVEYQRIYTLYTSGQSEQLSNLERRSCRILQHAFKYKATSRRQQCNKGEIPEPFELEYKPRKYKRSR